jgi:hypothetical protein
MADVCDENWFGSRRRSMSIWLRCGSASNEAANAFEPPADVPVITTLRGHGYRVDADDDQV